MNDLSDVVARMHQDLELAGHAERTRETYLRAVTEFAHFHSGSPQPAEP
jgi:hypothetical protein